MSVKIIHRDGKPPKYDIDPGPVRFVSPGSGIGFDFNYGARISLPPDQFKVIITDTRTGIADLYSNVGKSVVTSQFAYYIPYRIEVFSNEVLLFSETYDDRGKNVHIEMMTDTKLGDTLASVFAIESFRIEHECNVYVTLPEEYAAVLQGAYPEIHFIGIRTVVAEGHKDYDQAGWGKLPPDIYATYYMEMARDRELSPSDVRLCGLMNVAAEILGTKLKQQHFRPLLPSGAKKDGKKEKGPYVCFSFRAGTDWKEWKNLGGWVETVRYLKYKGYRVLCIDEDAGQDAGFFKELLKNGAEDYTGKRALQERVDLLCGAEFYIGISSGLSWLAWAAGIPVILISGISLPYTEFFTPYRVYNPTVCHGCWNDTDIKTRDEDGYCPRRGGTDREFECSREITAELVCRNIDRVMADRNNLKEGQQWQN